MAKKVGRPAKKDPIDRELEKATKKARARAERNQAPKGNDSGRGNSGS